MRTTFETDRQDKTARLFSTWEQLRFTGAHTFCLKTFVGKIVVIMRDSMQPESSIIASVEKVRSTMKPESYGWAVLGCVLNIFLRTPPREWQEITRPKSWPSQLTGRN